MMEPMTTTAADLLADHEHALFAFDGTICTLFAVLTAKVVANRLKAFLGREIPPRIAGTDDPFTVLRYARTQSDTSRQIIERELRRQEIIATETATEIPGIADVLRTLAITGHTATIVGNNATDAVRAYLADRKSVV